ncbi:MAG: TIGR01906 family membrane protein, partial [Clostridia bacterium]|nr:TIGR01906 family membrane protein [Clostridia bacterium]
FAGKENWVFNPYTDEIILALPQSFFANCAILIAASIIVLSLACVIFGLADLQKTKKAAK